MSITTSSPHEIAKAASLSSRLLATLNDHGRNEALKAIHSALLAERESILAANAIDLSEAKAASERGELSASVLKRLDLSRPGKYDDMLQGVLDVKGLEDPCMCLSSYQYRMMG